MILYNFQRALPRQTCIDQLTLTLDDEAPSFATMKQWYNQLNRSLADERREERPKTNSTKSWCDIL